MVVLPVVGDIGSYGATVPSTPVVGCGGASPPPCWAGTAVALCGGCDTPGGWFR